MADALEKYLGKIEYFDGFEGGITGNDELAEMVRKLGENRPGYGVVFAFGTMKTAWNAMPAEIRDIAVGALVDAIQVAGERVGQGLGDLPIVGWVAGMVVEMFKIVGENHRRLEATNRAWSVQQQNYQQIKTFERAKHPTDWVWGRVNGKLYMHYGGGSGYDRWRERPALAPVTIESRVVGFPDGNPTSGDCSPGKPFKSRGGKFVEKDDSPRCSYTTQFSALFYPFWSPAESPGPLTYYGPDVWPKPGFVDPGRDPNEILIKRQALLVGDPITNLQASGDAVQRLHDSFLQWVKYATGWKFDPSYVQAKESQSDPDAALYLDDNGMLHFYTRIAQEQRFTTDTGIAEADGVKVSVATYNCIVGMCRAFFTARASFLRNSVAMREYVKDGTVDSFHGNVRSAVRASAKGEGPKRTGRPRARRRRATKEEMAGGGAAIAVAGAAAAALFFLKR